MLQSTLPTLSVRSQSSWDTGEPPWEKTIMLPWMGLRMCPLSKAGSTVDCPFGSYQIRAMPNCDSKVPPVEEGKVPIPKPVRHNRWPQSI